MKNKGLLMGTIAAFGFAAVAHASDYERTEKNDTSTTLTGKKKMKHTKKVDTPTGTEKETTETEIPKNEDRMDHGRTREMSEKSDTSTTLTGKKKTKTTKKIENEDGTTTETTTEHINK